MLFRITSKKQRQYQFLRKVTQEIKQIIAQWAFCHVYLNIFESILIDQLDAYIRSCMSARISGFSFVEACEMICLVFDYAEDNTVLACDDTRTGVNSKLAELSRVLMDWFTQNFDFSLESNCNSELNLEGAVTPRASSCVRLLAVDVNRRLLFSEHVRRICKQASKKLNVLCRIYMLSTEEKRTLVRSFMLCQFKFCPTVWTLCSVTYKKKRKYKKGHYVLCTVGLTQRPKT